jgi:hypothetical protein
MLTQGDMDRLDESACRHSGGWVERFELAETRARPVRKRPRFPRLEARKRKLAQLEREMRLPL